MKVIPLAEVAIQELYTEDCVLYAPPGTFVGHDALDKFARRSSSDASPLCLYASWCTPGSAQFGTSGVGLGAEGRSIRVHPVSISSSHATAILRLFSVYLDSSPT